MRLREKRQLKPSRKKVAPKFVWRGLLWVRRSTSGVIAAFARGPHGEQWYLSGAQTSQDLMEAARSLAPYVLRVRIPLTAPYRLSPWDTIPWEIHEIDDDRVRKEAKRRFKQERRRLRARTPL